MKNMHVKDAMSIERKKRKEKKRKKEERKSTLLSVITGTSQPLSSPGAG